MPIIAFLLFGGVDYYVTQVEYDQLEHMKSYYLDQMKMNGTLTDDVKSDIYNRLTTKGYKNIVIEATDGNGNPIDSSNIIVRNVENPAASTMNIDIKATPPLQPFFTGKILGINSSSGFYFDVGDPTLSEQPANSQ